MLGMLEKEDKVAEQHLEFSKKITNEICKTLDNYVKTKEGERKKIAGEGQKHIKTVQDSVRFI
jgi:hypothetical protein